MKRTIEDPKARFDRLTASERAVYHRIGAATWRGMTRSFPSLDDRFEAEARRQEAWATECEREASALANLSRHGLGVNLASEGRA